MTRSICVAVAAAALALPAFAQSAAELTCEEYAALDDAGKMEMVAELESVLSESSESQEMSSVDIEQTLAADCTEPEMMIVDVVMQE